MSARVQGAHVPRVRVSTELGELLLEIETLRAPRSAAAFLRYVDGGRLDGARFVRTVRVDNDRGTPPIEIIQATASSLGDSPPTVEHESTAETGIAHVDGVVSLPRKEVGSASPSSFFICLGDQPTLDFGGRRKADGFGFAAFGRVVAGMDIVRRIHRQPTIAEAEDAYFRGQLLAEPVAIRFARRETGPLFIESAVRFYQ